MKKLVILFLMFLNISAHADVLSSCLEKVSKNKNFQSGITEIFGDTDLSESNVFANKQQIYTLLSKSISENCGNDLVVIAKQQSDRGIIYFTHNKKEYGFDFSITEMFNGLGIQTGILVINKSNLGLNKVLTLSEIPKKQKFFKDACSDWTIADNLDDDAAVNIAGQAVFSEFGGSENEFFLDFAEGDNRRAFPGLVLMDETGSATEQIVTFLNLKTGITKAQQFAEKLKGTQCSGLSVYLVGLNVSKDYSEANAWEIGATGAATLTGATIGGVALAHAAGVGAVFLAVPVAGWIVGGVILATAGAMYGVAMIPQTIQDIQQVIILDGPYNL